MDAEKQEICNQLNRRTEFSVLRTTYNMFDEQGKLKKQSKNKQQKPSLPKNEDTPIIFVE